MKLELTKQQLIRLKEIQESPASLVILTSKDRDELLQALPLLYIDDPDTYCVMISRFDKESVDRTRSAYEALKSSSRHSETCSVVILDNGAKIEGHTLGTTLKAKTNWSGAQITLLCIHDAEYLDPDHIAYLRTRLRSKSSYPSKLVLAVGSVGNRYLRNLMGYWYKDSYYTYPDDTFPTKGIQCFWKFDEAHSGHHRYYYLKRGVYSIHDNGHPVLKISDYSDPYMQRPRQIVVYGET